MGNIFSRLFSGRLVPTVRVDKNGRVVIRHMKPVSGNESGAAIPSLNAPPVNHNSEAHEELLLSATDVLLRKSYMANSGRDAERLEKAMKRFSDETLSRISKLHGPAGDLAVYFLHLELEGESDEVHVRDLLELSSFLDDRDITTDNIVLSIKRYDFLHPLNESGSYPDERYRQITRLVESADAIRRSGSSERDSTVFDYAKISKELAPVIRIADEKLVDTILGASDAEYEQIITIMRERAVSDPDSIKELMSGPSALSSGAL